MNTHFNAAIFNFDEAIFKPIISRGYEAKCITYLENLYDDKNKAAISFEIEPNDSLRGLAYDLLGKGKPDDHVYTYSVELRHKEWGIEPTITAYDFNENRSASYTMNDMRDYEARASLIRQVNESIKDLPGSIPVEHLLNNIEDDIYLERFFEGKRYFDNATRKEQSQKQFATLADQTHAPRFRLPDAFQWSDAETSLKAVRSFTDLQIFPSVRIKLDSIPLDFLAEPQQTAPTALQEYPYSYGYMNIEKLTKGEYNVLLDLYVSKDGNEYGYIPCHLDRTSDNEIRAFITTVDRECFNATHKSLDNYLDDAVSAAMRKEARTPGALADKLLETIKSTFWFPVDVKKCLEHNHIADTPLPDSVYYKYNAIFKGNRQEAFNLFKSIDSAINELNEKYIYSDAPADIKIANFIKALEDVKTVLALNFKAYEKCGVLNFGTMFPESISLPEGFDTDRYVGMLCYDKQSGDDIMPIAFIEKLVDYAYSYKNNQPDELANFLASVIPGADIREIITCCDDSMLSSANRDLKYEVLGYEARDEAGIE